MGGFLAILFMLVLTSGCRNRVEQKTIASGEEKDLDLKIRFGLIDLIHRDQNIQSKGYGLTI